MKFCNFSDDLLKNKSCKNEKTFHCKKCKLVVDEYLEPIGATNFKEGKSIFAKLTWLDK